MEILSFALFIVMVILLIVQNILGRQKIRSAREEVFTGFFPEYNGEVQTHITSMEQGLIACIAKTDMMRHSLFTLLGSDKPLDQDKIFQIVRTKFAPNPISENAVKMSLRLLMNGSFVKLGVDGCFSLTSLGNELCSRISQVK